MIRVIRTLVLVLLLVGSSWVYGTDYHVDGRHPAASDSNPGTLSQPWKTLSRANAKLAPGDSVYVHAGRYGDPIEPRNSGTPAAPISYEVWGEDAVYLDENRMNAACIALSDRSHILVKGFRVDRPGRNQPAYARMSGAQHCVIEKCDFSGSKVAYFGMLIGGHDAKRESSYNTFRDIRMSGCNGDLICLRGNVHHNLFVRCRLSDTGTDTAHTNLMIQGLRPHGESPCYNAFVECEFVAVHRHAVNLAGGPHHNLFDRCVLRNAHRDANAMQMAASDNIFRRCLVIQNQGHLRDDTNTFCLYTARDRLFEEGGYHPYSTAERNRIYHNTFTGNLGYSISCYYWPGLDRLPYGIGQNLFVNNIFVFNGGKKGGGEISYSDGRGKIAGDVWSHNLIGHDPEAKVVEWEDRRYTLKQWVLKVTSLNFDGNIQADPLFGDAQKGDYSLKPGSPCIDAGRPLTYATSAGTGTMVPVKDSKFFCDGYGIFEGDMVVIGSNEPVRVVSVPDDTHIVVSAAVTWEDSDPVSLPYYGKGPDMGALEHSP